MKASSSYKQSKLSQITGYISSRISRKWILWFATFLFIVSTGAALYQPVHPDPWHVHTGWDKFIYPQEKNAFLRQPSISANINSVTTVDGQLWAVGNGGLILNSTDGGLCWTPKGPWVKTEGRSTCSQQKTGLQRIFPGLFATNVDSDTLLDSIIPKAYAADVPKQSTSNLKKELNKELYNLAIQQKKAPDIKPETPAKIKPSASLECGGLNQRACNTRERVPSCDKGLVETAQKKCVPPKTVVEENLNYFPDLQAIAFIDNQTSIAVGINGTILRSVDGGASWDKVDSGIQSWLTSLAVLDNNRIIAVGSNGTILRSVDGGASWAQVDSGSQSPLTSLAILDKDHIIAAGYDGTILRSNDGGTSWTKIESSNQSPLSSLAALDNNLIIAVGDKGTILRSDDRGASWAQADSATQSLLSSLAVLDKNHIIAAGYDGTILRSDDGGASWGKVDSGTQSELISLTVLDKNSIIAVGFEGTILRSDDRGDSWAQVDNGTQSSFNSLAVLDNNHIIAVGSSGSILRSDDGGESWSQVDSGTQSSLTTLTVLDSNHIIVLGETGTILHSVDGGDSWAKVDSGTQSWLYFLAVLDNNRIIVAGDAGTILLSDDGGDSWTKIDSGTQSSPTSLAVLDNNHIIAFGFGGTILRSVDEGDSWVQVVRGTQSLLRSVAVLGNNRIIAVGDIGTILRSDDGGASWAQVVSGTQSRLTSIAVLSNNHIIATGDAGTILRSVDGGNSWARIDHYAVSLANWWYLFTALIIGLVLLAVWPRLEQAEEDGIAGLAASDKPLQPGDPDALNLGSIASDITAFLSNPKTTAPLTMAITGPWGSGKSSLMNLVRADLEQRGFSPVWFNAWHHQKGEQLLASLFAHIKLQAIPSWFSFDGLWFRIKLAYIRGRRHWFIFAIMLSLLFMTLSLNKQAFGDIATNLSRLSDPKLWWDIPWHDWIPNLQALFLGEDWIQTLASIFGIGTPLVALLRSIRGFGISPNRLVSIDRGVESNKGYDPGARARFAKEFQDVTRALGNNKMVIFIDDLDRCSQSNLIDILENINFIASSGDCFMLLGMAPKYIEACVANHYETLAKSIAEKEKHESSNHSDDLETHKFRFAHNYLEKMINIEVRIPHMQANSIDQLLNLQSEQTPNTSWFSSLNISSRSLGKAMNIFIPVLFILLAIGSGWEYGRKIPAKPKPEPQPVYELRPADQETLLSLAQLGDDVHLSKKLIGRTLEQSVEGVTNETLNLFSIALQADKKTLENGIKIGSLGQGNNKASVLLKFNPEEQKPVIKVVDTASDKTVTPDKVLDRSNNQPAVFRQASFETGPRLSALWLLFGILVFVSFAFYLYHKKKDKYAEDSDDFKDALTAWTPWIQLKQETPRGVKRFLNHLRFLAIRNNHALNESVLVSIATIYFYNANWILDETKFTQVCEKKLYPLLKEIFSIKENQKEVDEALVSLSHRMEEVLTGIDTGELSKNRELAITILSGGSSVSPRQDLTVETSQREKI
jgi:photosystem II stability/assembly factor-like uncharacterized protein